jgi:tetratricopeptide (TPR) repeat protein
MAPYAGEEPSRSAAGHFARAAALVGLLALALLPAVLRGGWALDDRELLFDNPVTGAALPWTEAFARDYVHHLGGSGAWRPLASLSLRLDRALFGEWCAGYHLVNWGLHVGVVVLALALLRGLGLGLRQLATGLVVFALHPLLVDSVVWISGRTSMLSALPPLAGLVGMQLALRRGRAAPLALLPAALGLMAGLLAKEDALVFAPLLLLIAGQRSSKHLGVALAAVALVLGLWCAGRAWALGTPWPEATQPALPGAPLVQRLELGGAAILEALRLVLLPADYPPQYRADLLLSRHGALGGAPAALGGWLLLAAPLLLLGLRRRRAGVRLTSAALAALAFLPVAQLVPLGEVFAPRFLYLPLLFAVPLVGDLGARLLPGARGTAALGALALLLAGLTFERAAVYADRGAWRAELLRFVPDDAPSWNDIGLWREERGDRAGAQAAWERAIACDGSYSKSWSNLGRAHLEAGELAQAQTALRQAVRVGPRNAIAHVNLASALARSGRGAEAAELYERATQLAPGLGPAWRGWGQALAAQREFDAARAALERALRLDPGDRIAQTLRARLPPAAAD